MSRKFQRKKEDFECGNCGLSVKGDGYTNHCPDCLWSKHVDISPGDRLEVCEGLMRPVRLEAKKRGECAIVHSCIKCGYTKKNKKAENDNYEALIKIGNK
ncbi:MAG: RNHCP domain-containing protein [Patescibacteria group bacterium]